MSLYSYQKAPYSFRSERLNYSRNSNNIAFELQREPLTVWKLLQGLKNDLKYILTSSKLAGTLIPAILILYGINLLSVQIIPAITEHLQEQRGYFDQGSTSLVSGEYISAKQQYLSNPGSEYFQKLQSDAYQTNTLRQDPVSENYKGVFKLSLPALGLYDLPVRANVNSGVETIYDQILDGGLAHMEKTGLPISDVNNNIVIYGHSATGNYYERTGDVAASFSVLNETKVGDEAIITIDGKTFKYKVVKTKIVDPYDLSIITGNNPNKQTLTLFTCYPAGNNGNRLVVIANPVD